MRLRSDYRTGGNGGFNDGLPGFQRLFDRFNDCTFRPIFHAPYSGTIAESLSHIAETRYTKDGEEYTAYSSAAGSHLKARASVLMKRAEIADRKRYGEDKAGQTINIGVQTNIENTGPQSLEELQSMSLNDLIDSNRPGTN